ncbi:MAG: hypothetical protein IKU02_00450 [Bacteroidaceae bacterium]|nr:hypothetical protein [Bacteroidaceae bacterium]
MATSITTARSIPNTFTLTVPKADVSFFKAFAKKMGWMIERKKATTQKPKEFDVTKTASFRAAMDDVKHGRVTTYASLGDFYKEMGL